MDAQKPPAKRRMGKLQRRLLQQQFVDLLLNLELKLSRLDICERLGISESTYQRWSTDPEVLKLAALDGSRIGHATRAYAYEHRGTALKTLVSVMESSRNDVARVRAAELMYQWGNEAAESEQPPDTDAAAEVATLLANRGPTFIIAKAEMFMNSRGEVSVSAKAPANDDATVVEVPARLLPAASAPDPD